MNRIRVLHVISQLRRGGPLQSLISAKKHLDSTQAVHHHIASLGPADRHASAEAAAAGISGISAPSKEELRNLVEEADIVQVHFWNNPDIHHFLRSNLAPMRLVVWCHVNGRPPHVIPAYTAGMSDVTVVTAAATLELPTFKTAQHRAILAHSVADFSRLTDCRPTAHEGFRVGYIGSLSKLHESFATMCAAVAVPSARFIICGDGSAEKALKRNAAELGIIHQFEFHGYRDDVGSVLATLDVFGYPLTAENSTTAELALQEAMFAGVPPVVFADGGPGEIVKDLQNGIVVESQAEYAAAVEWLFRHPTERRRLGRQAASDMLQREKLFSRTNDQLYRQVMGGPKLWRAPSVLRTDHQDGLAGTNAFLQSLDGQGDAPFLTSANSSDDFAAQAADERIAQTNAIWQDVILQYRLRSPDNAYLRLWAGLGFRTRGHAALAAAEFRASMALGFNTSRVQRYYAECMRAGRANSTKI